MSRYTHSSKGSDRTENSLSISVLNTMIMELSNYLTGGADPIKEGPRGDYDRVLREARKRLRGGEYMNPDFLDTLTPGLWDGIINNVYTNEFFTLKRYFNIN